MLTAVSMIWAGLTALIVYQATPFARVLLQVGKLRRSMIFGEELDVPNKIF